MCGLLLPQEKGQAPTELYMFSQNAKMDSMRHTEAIYHRCSCKKVNHELELPFNARALQRAKSINASQLSAQKVFR